MRVLVLGSGGPIGQAVAARARSTGAYVIGATRSTSSAAFAEHERILADRAVAASIASAVCENRIDIVIDIVAYTAEETRQLLAQLDGLVQRYVLVSSCDVYRNYGLLHRKEMGPPMLEAMNESAPLRSSRYPYRMASPRAADDPSRWMDDYDKITVEEAVSRLTSDWTILRLPMVFGPGDKQRRFRWAIAPMLAQVKELELPERWAAWVTSYGHIDNVAAAVVHASDHPRAEKAIFNIGDYEPVGHRLWIERFRDATDWNGVVVETASDEHPLAQATAGLDLAVPLKCSTALLEETLSFRPPISLQAAIESTVRDESARA